MIALKDLAGQAKELGIQQWLRGCSFAVIVASGDDGVGCPTYFAASPEWTDNDAKFMANYFGGVAVDLRGDDCSACAAIPDDHGIVCSRECVEEQAGGCGAAL